MAITTTIEVLRIPGTLFPRGPYDENAAYKFLNFVEDGGNGYVCLQPCTGVPVTNTAYWFKFVFRGEKGDAFTYADLTAAQKAELVQDATAAAQAAASSAQSAADDAAAALQKFNTIKAAIDALDPTSTEGSIQTLAAKQGLLEANLNALGLKVSSNESNIANLQQEIDEIEPIVINGDVTNAPDEEDVTTDSNNLLKLKDRPTAVNQKGYKILRKGASLASQMVDTNTIYEVRYAFDISDLETIPSGSRFKFNGGSLVINGVKITNLEIDALDAGMIPNVARFANYNAERLVSIINAGFSLVVNDSFYIGQASTAITSDVKIKGNGKLIKTSGSTSFEIGSQISIDIQGVSFVGDYAASTQTFAILFDVPKTLHIYNPLVKFVNCHIDNVRVYSHIADDVDQTNVKDGVKNFVFRNNTITNIGYYCVRLQNCLSEQAEVVGNDISNFMSVVFDFAVDNNYQNCSFTRMKYLKVESNTIDNSDYVMVDGYTTGYFTPFLIEAETCVFNNNSIKNIICSATQTPVPVYAAYISCDKVEFRNNYIYNVINVGDSTYNECFKAKGTTGGASERVIKNNTYIVSSDVTEGYNTPSIKFFSLQTSGSLVCRLLDISDNTVLVDSCNFAWGAASELIYKNAYLCRNNVVCNGLASNAVEMFRLRANSDNDGVVNIIGNKMTAINATGSAATILREQSGYKIEIRDNELANMTSFGQFNTRYSNLEIISKGNKFVMSSNPGAIRVYNMNVVDDEIILYNEPNCIIYPDLVDSFSFALKMGNKTFGLVKFNWSGSNSTGLYKMTLDCAIGKSSVYCRADTTEVIAISDSGSVQPSISRTAQTESVSIGFPLSTTIGLGSATIAENEVAISPSSYIKDFKPSIIVEKYQSLPNINAFGGRWILSNSNGMYNSSLRPYLTFYNNRLGYVINGVFCSPNGLKDGSPAGTTADRPSLRTPDAGFLYFDKTLGKVIVWDGGAWKNTDGTSLT